MKTLTLLITLFFISSSMAQMTKTEIEEHRTEHHEHLLDTASHLLKLDEIESFVGLDYFDFDSTFQINARFIKSKGKKFEMPTSTDRLPVYRRYGFIEFEIAAQTCTLEVYQNLALRKEKEFRKHLFIPFRDGTSRNETYGGGRFMDVEIPNGKTLEIDFNLAYNPYCAYSHRYSCPIPPEANTLIIPIKAGEKTPMAH
ncbi:MAG: hypothetical protein ACI865_001455 [Flavobacteriaceae bacterium]|jgi:uncharacterized protein (DUF1684 family)